MILRCGVLSCAELAYLQIATDIIQDFYSRLAQIEDLETQS